MPDHVEASSRTIKEVFSNLISAETLRDGAVWMLCGVAGSGKTTAATILEAAGFVRLSIDEEIWESNGKFGKDYEPSAYAGFQVMAEQRLRARLVDLMREGKPVVLDFSFWQRARREEYKRLIEAHGRPWLLLHLRASREALEERLLRRSERFDANAAFPISEQLLDRYLQGFETPSGEGEIIVDTDIPVG